MKRTIPVMIVVAILTTPVLTLAWQAVDDQPKVRSLVARLDHDQFSIREKASAELLALAKNDKSTAARLRQALQTAKSPEVKARLSYILARCGGGQVINGLKFRLTADRKSVRPGENVRFTTTISNTTKSPINLYVGYSTGGVNFVSGSALKVTGDVKDAKTASPKWCVGFCGTGAGPLFKTLGPGESVNYQAQATFALPNKAAVAQKPARRIAPNVPHYRLGGHMMTLVPPKTDVHHFRMEHVVNERMNQDKGFAKGGGGIRPTDPSAPFWVGSIQSNSVPVKVIDVK